MRGRGWMLGVLASLVLLHMGAGAGPKPPRDLRFPPALSFSEVQGYLQRASAVARTLVPGALVRQPTPQGPRLALRLDRAGRSVAFAYLTPDLRLAERRGAPLLADSPDDLPAPSASQRAALARLVAGLNVSGLADVVGPEVHCYLLSGGRLVAELHFDRRSGALLPDLGAPPGPPRLRPHGRP